MGQKISNMGQAAYEGAANMANSAAETLGLTEKKWFEQKLFLPINYLILLLFIMIFLL